MSDNGKAYALHRRIKEADNLRQQLAAAQAENEALRSRVAELEEACINVHRDLLLRSEPDWDDSDVKVVNLSAGYWDDLCRVAGAVKPRPDQGGQGDGWIRCSERLPRYEDSDWTEMVFAVIAEDGAVVVQRWSHVLRNPRYYSHWMSTGLKRPQPPVEQGEG